MSARGVPALAAKNPARMGHPQLSDYKIGWRCPNSTERKGGRMQTAVYNSAIPHSILNTVNRFLPSGVRLTQISIALIAMAIGASAADWNIPEQNLARKIVAVTGPGAVALTVENRSSLGRRDTEIVRNGLQNALQAAGLRFVAADQAAAIVSIFLSENPDAYVWVAEIRQGTNEPAVVMVSTPRLEGSIAARDAAPLTLRKILLWTQDEPILDVAVLEETPAPSQIAVLSAETISLYRMQAGKWELEHELPIVHQRPWPRDLRGRLIPAKEHLFEAYLPGVTCLSTTTSSLTLNCRESEDPWPLVSGGLSGGALSVFPSAGLANGASTVVPQMKAFFAPTRNFFTGVLTPGVGKFTAMPKFYSAAVLPRDQYRLWLFAAVDGQTHLVDGMSDQAARLGWGNEKWGSDLASVKTPCGAGWQVLANSASAAADSNEDSLRAYEFPDRDPVAVSPAIDFPGPISALWTESKGDSAIAVINNREKGSYEAYRVAMSCGQ